MASTLGRDPKTPLELPTRCAKGKMVHHKSLTAIANHRGTDKGTVGPSLSWPAHNHTEIYEA